MNSYASCNIVKLLSKYYTMPSEKYHFLPFHDDDDDLEFPFLRENMKRSVLLDYLLVNWVHHCPIYFITSYSKKAFYQKHEPSYLIQPYPKYKIPITYHVTEN